MREWVEKNSGPVDRVKNQEIIKVTNLVTLEGALFNWLPGRPPGGRSTCRSGPGGDRGGPKAAPFAARKKRPPADPFGRVRGRYCLTASNIAKYDGHHGVIILMSTTPWRFPGTR